jgi:hypothetical protein
VIRATLVSPTARTAAGLCRALAVIALAAWYAGALTLAQDQPPSGPGWPCNGRPDPTYFRVAEGTGGQFFLFHPSEVAGSGALMAASMSHGATVLRAGGQLAAGLHELMVPVDRVDSLLFSISVQCLQLAEIVRPSGAVLQAAEAGVDYSQFEAGRIVTVGRPEPGRWLVRLSGSRLFLVAIQAKTALSLEAPRLVPGGPPRAGIRQVLRFRVGGDARDVTARLVTQAFQNLALVPLRVETSDTGDEFIGEVTPPVRPFRLVVSGSDADGLPFQRVHAPLFEPATPAP